MLIYTSSQTNTAHQKDQLFPGVNYYISQWYQRHECGFRMALFFSAATLAGAFGGILARGIAEMSGVGGKSAWSWICMLCYLVQQESD